MLLIMDTGSRLKVKGTRFRVQTESSSPCPLQRRTKAATNGKRIKDKGTRLKVQGARVKDRLPRNA